MVATSTPLLTTRTGNVTTSTAARAKQLAARDPLCLAFSRAHSAEAVQWQVAQLEASISELEAKLRSLEQDLAIASMTQKVDRIRELGTTYAAVERELYDKLAAWAEVGHEAA